VGKLEPKHARLALLGWLVLCVGGGALIGVLTPSGGSAWYQALQKPAFNPPNWVFAPVWTTLYALMGFAAWRVWRHGGWDWQGPSLKLFLIQLVLNFSWSFVFFTFERIGWALATILLLWLMIVLTIRAFANIDRAAAWGMAPYLAWVTFATVLNGALAVLN
jgi:tryptophan-rich sensory protein